MNPVGAEREPPAPSSRRGRPGVDVEIPDLVPGDALRCVRVRRGDELYARLLAFAAARYRLPVQRIEAPEDEWSDVLAFLDREELVATVTATRDARGPIEASEHYPAALLSAFGGRIATVYRLAAAPGRSALGLMAMRTACWFVIRRGVRLALFSAKPELTRWYRRIGFLAASEVTYRHPRLGSEHVPMYCPVHPAHASAFADLFARIRRPLARAEVERVLASRDGRR